jgi:hypothetical protein|tara:strand:+ start:791 stop:1117 length:327 start_codon:yes stop_codon:yes gene_type:complete
MKKTNSIIATFLILLFLNACTSISEGLGGVKKKTNEEFLVEKKAPLVIPPNFGELPEPGKKKDKNTTLKNDKLSIEEKITKSPSLDENQKNNKIIGSIEKSIIEKINE